MLENRLVSLFVMAFYMFGIMAIGFVYSKHASKSAEHYFLGGRSLGPWVAAFSAEASDMSGYLLMGIPGLAYWSGLCEAGWTCIGLAIGTYLNFVFVSKKLRLVSEKINAFTIPDYFSKRFNEKKKVLLLLSSLVIVIFFCVYAGQCLSACGKLFANLFGLSYTKMMIVSAIFVLVYTFLGGFLAESVSDFIQAILMIAVLVMVLIIATIHAGGVGEIINNAKSIPGYFSLVNISSPIEGEIDKFASAKPFGIFNIVSTLAWGLGYFGMPQVLLRFMGIRSEKELTLTRRVAVIWVVISMFAAIFIGVAARSIIGLDYTSNSFAENVFVDSAIRFLPTVFAALAASGVIAASVSSSDSYLLTSASAISQSIYKGIIKKDATDKNVIMVSRIALCTITFIAAIIAYKSNATIFKITSFAWAGFGASFGPLMLFSLFWEKTTYKAAISGMVTGGAMVFIWKLLISKLGGIFQVYELLPSFIISCLVIYFVSYIENKTNNK